MVDQAFAQFLSLVKGDQASQAQEQRMAQQLSQDKAYKLIPMRQLFKRMMDVGLVVRHNSTYNPGTLERQAPQVFSVFEDDSSTPWRPGQSLYFDHPAMVEVSIPNPVDVPREGPVVIKCSTPHPQSGLLARKFDSMEEACMAMSRFWRPARIWWNGCPPMSGWTRSLGPPIPCAEPRTTPIL